MPAPSLIVTNARIYTSDSSAPWAEGLAVASDGTIAAVGSTAEIEKLEGSETQRLDAAGGFVMPGLVDVHVHLNLGGQLVAFELPIAPGDSVDVVLSKVKEWGSKLAPNEWIVGGIIGSTTLDFLAANNHIHKLDEASGGRPVLIRDDSQHNRWVSSKAFELMGVNKDTPDPHEGRFVKDDKGELTGVLHESATTSVENAFRASIPNKDERMLEAMETAVKVLNSYGVTSCQEAAMAIGPAKAIQSLEKKGKLRARIVGSSMARMFIEEGIAGEELYEAIAPLKSKNFIPSFTKCFIDGVPITRTAHMLRSYKCACKGHESGGSNFKGSSYWTMDELTAHLNRCVDLNLGAKMHATGDGAVKLVLDAVAAVKAQRGTLPIMQIAHAEYIAPDDMPRFKELEVVADLSPYIWFPSVIQESIAAQLEQDVIDGSWPARQFVDQGVLIAAGSDWPCAAPTPDPWTGLQTLVTRANPDPAVTGTLNPGAAITLSEAVAAFTCNPAKAMGLGEVAGKIKEGYSADFIFLDRNVFECDVGQIYETKVLKTFFEGKMVHEVK